MTVSEWATTQQQTEASPGTGGRTDLDEISFYTNFEGVDEGRKIGDAYAFFYEDDNTECTTADSYPGGTKCMETHPDSGTTSSTSWGYTADTGFIGCNIVQGSEIWLRHAVKYPTGYDTTTTYPGIPLILFGRENHDGSSDGFIGVLLRKQSIGGQEVLQTSFHSSSEQLETWHESGIATGTWVHVEFYLKLDSVAQSKGGQAEMILWINGERVYREVGYPTCGPNCNSINGYAFHSEWPGNAPHSTVSWFDHLAICAQGATASGTIKNDVNFMARDAFGAPFIGTEVNHDPPEQPGNSDPTAIELLGGLHYDFEYGSNGTPIESVEPDINGASNGVISTAQSYSGTRSFNTHIKPGDQGGFGKWGGIWGENGSMPELARGGEVWVRWYNYFHANWANETDPKMKYMRISTRDPQHVHEGGYNDVYINGLTPQTTSETTDYEPGSANWVNAPSWANIQKERWLCHEFYCRLDNVEKSRGGMGHLKMWVDGIPVIDHPHTTTLRSAGGYLDRVLWHTWHQTDGDGSGGGQTSRHDEYIDLLTIAFRGPLKGGGQLDCTPAMTTDQDGFIYIGLA